MEQKLNLIFNEETKNKANKIVFKINAQCCDIINNLIKKNNMNYSLDPNREMPYIVIDNLDEVGMEGVYAGSLEDCKMYIAEQAKYTSCIGIDIVPNPNYKVNCYGKY